MTFGFFVKCVNAFRIALMEELKFLIN